jgi:hypothetical protein
VPDPGARQLRLSDWLVLCVVCEQPTHGFAIAGLFSHDGSLGRVWQVQRPPARCGGLVPLTWLYLT